HEQEEAVRKHKGFDDMLLEGALDGRARGGRVFAPVPAAAPAMAMPAEPAPPAAPVPLERPVAQHRPPVGRVLAAEQPARPPAADRALDEATARDALGKKEKAVFGRDDKALRANSAAGQGLVIVREYAHAARKGRQDGDRVDFTETLLWKAAARTDARTG